MSQFRRIRFALKALSELGPRQVGLYIWYRLGLRSGYFKWTMKAGESRPRTQRQPLAIHHFLGLPGRSELTSLLGETGVVSLLAEADEIVAGKVRLFGGPAVALRLKPPEPLAHWTVYALGRGVGDGEDIKFIWEPGRFGWAITLGRAYHLSGDECYAGAFWNFTENFLETNPPNMGLQWASAQEVALRLIALAFSSQVFAKSSASTPDRMSRLAETLVDHAERIPPTMAYARAQNNNHLLTEAVGLYTAGVALPDHPRAISWRESGWRWLNRALQTQIADDGTYVQHSTNYQRLVLQAVLWANTIAAFQGEALPHKTISYLSAATRWLVNLLDPDTGFVPNLGPNDGAYILPFSICPFEDYRPVLQAACLAFCGERLFDEGLWDEMGMWLDVVGSRSKKDPTTYNHKFVSPYVLRSKHSWAYLRVAQFTSRPGHADQLHLDLWWRGVNIAQDPGTYLYNASFPWDNALVRTEVHNTITVNGKDQMIHAGRFLWLDWAQGELVDHNRADEKDRERLTAQHNGYRGVNAIHQRTVTVYKDDRWIVEDRLLSSVIEDGELTNLPSGDNISTINLPIYNLRLHWLLPDWSWMIELGKKGTSIRLESPYGMVRLSIRTGDRPQSKIANSALRVQLARAGELIYGSGYVHPSQGWISRTYGCKEPALSFSIETTGSLPLTMVSEWRFPDNQ